MAPHLGDSAGGGSNAVSTEAVAGMGAGASYAAAAAAAASVSALGARGLRARGGKRPSVYLTGSQKATRNDVGRKQA